MGMHRPSTTDTELLTATHLGALCPSVPHPDPQPKPPLYLQTPPLCLAGHWYLGTSPVSEHVPLSPPLSPTARPVSYSKCSCLQCPPSPSLWGSRLSQRGLQGPCPGHGSWGAAPCPKPTDTHFFRGPRVRVPVMHTRHSPATNAEAQPHPLP